MAKTKIEWADKVWNPVTGCTKVSEGCRNCYAERIAKRFWRNGINGDNYRPFSGVRCHPERLEQPLHWKKPARIFVDSMGDLFHEKVPNKFISQVFWVMEMAPIHTFLVLTKRPKRMMEFVSQYYQGLLSNIWLGVSVEDQKTADERIPWLLKTPSAIRFVSIEPMLGPIDLDGEKSDDLHALGCGDKFCTCGDRGIDWVICGGETGPGARPLQPEWAESLLSQCREANIPFFFKQWGEWSNSMVMNGKHTMTRMGKRRAGRHLLGQTWDEYPDGL